MSYAPYSYSKLSTHKKCPARFKYAYVDRIQTPKSESPQMQRGTEIHESVEHFMLGATPQLHPDIHERYGQFFLGLRQSHQCFPELAFAINKEFQPVPYDDPTAWFRGYFDLKILPLAESQGELIVYEFKTGGIYDAEHADQRLKYGTVALVQHPEFDRVKVITVYLDKTEFREVVYYRMMMKEYEAMLRREISGVEADTVFITKPQFLCRYCPFSKNVNPEMPCPF